MQKIVLVIEDDPQKNKNGGQGVRVAQNVH